MPPAASTEPRSDGRVARRERGRRAVIDATLDLLLEHGVLPTPEAVVQRAEVSLSSLFRYVDGLVELQLAAIERFRERYGDLFEVPEPDGHSLSDRVSMLVDARLRLHSTVAPVSRLVRRRLDDTSGLDEALKEIRATQLVQVRRYFAPELARRSAAEADDLAHVITTLTSFESWDMLQGLAGRGPVQIRRAWRSALLSLLR